MNIIPKEDLFVIFIDSDYNPYRSIQAFFKAVQLEKNKNIKTIKLVSRGTIEEKLAFDGEFKVLRGDLYVKPIN